MPCDTYKMPKSVSFLHYGDEDLVCELRDCDICAEAVEDACILFRARWERRRCGGDGGWGRDEGEVVVLE